MAGPSDVGSFRVLVVEDESFIADELTKTLHRHGAEVIGPLGSLNAALAQVRDDGFDVVVLDVNLRDEMAYPVADELRSREIPFVFATGYSADSIPARFQDVECWEKPYDEDALARSVARISAARLTSAE